MTDEIVIPAEGLPYLMTWMLKSAISGVVDPQLLLFSNTLDPDCTVTLADLTECSFTGYTRFTLNRSAWDAPAVVGCCGIMLYGGGPIAWTNTSSPATVAGYAFIYPVDDSLLAVQALAAPLTIPTLGTLSFTPQFTLTSGACP